MLINKIIKQLILYISLFCSFNTFAFVHTIEIYTINGVTLTGAADASQFMKTIYAGGNRSTTICNDKSTSYTLGRVEFTPIGSYMLSFKPSPSHTIQHLFNMGFLGLGNNPNYTAYFINQTGPMESTVSGVPRTIGIEKQTLWSGSVANDSRGFHWGYLTYILKSADQIQPGIYQVPEISDYYLDCYDNIGNLQQRHEFKTSTFIITSEVTSCTPAQSSKIINMNSIPIANVEDLAVGTLFGTKQQMFSLNCDPNVQVKFSVSDLLDPSNIGGTVATLESGGATGVGYVVSSPNSSYPNGYTFSPVGVSTPNAPNLSQYTIEGGGIAGSAPTNVVDHTLTFSYIKTSEEVTEGKANAIIGITYSYQ